MKPIIALALTAIIGLTAIPAPALAFREDIPPGERLYAGCVTKAELFEAVRQSGGIPKMLVSVNNGVAIIRGKESRKQYNYYVLACDLLVQSKTQI